MTALADTVLPLIRTRSEVWRWNIANAHGSRMHEAVAILQQAADDDPAEVFTVTQRAIASALKVITVSRGHSPGLEPGAPTRTP